MVSRWIERVAGAPTSGARSRVWLTLIVTLLATFGVVAGPAGSVAHAAEIVGAITSVRIDDESTIDYESFRIDLDWAVPETAAAGDTFWIDLPPEVVGGASGFPFSLMSPDGADVVAVATIDSATGIITFTLTDYVEDHDAVTGSAWFTAAWNREIVNGPTTVALTFATNGASFDDSVEVTPGEPGTGHIGPNKWGGFLTGDLGRLQWGLESPNGPIDVVVFDDHLGDGVNDPGLSIDCATARVRETAVTGGAWIDIDPGRWSMTCSPTDINVTVNDIAVGTYVIVTYETVITDPDVDVYTNSVTITSDGGEVSEQLAEVIRDAAGGGGAGSGRVPAISIEKWSTADGFPAGDFDTAPGKSLTADVATPITFTITNTGNESLVDIVVADTTNTGPALTGINCTFPDDTTGVSWDGPWAVNGAAITCTATLPAMSAGTAHSDTASVTAVGRFSAIPVGDDDPWFGSTPAIVDPTTTTTSTTTTTTVVASAGPTTTSTTTTLVSQLPVAPTTTMHPVTGSSLPVTGGGSGLAVMAALLLLLGAVAFAAVRTRPEPEHS